MPEPYPKMPQKSYTHLLGGVGCFVYIVLFFTSGMFVNFLGWHTLWVLLLMAIYIFIWLGAVYWAILRDRRNKR